MSVSGGDVAAGRNIKRNHRCLGENRFYSPPPLRKYRQKQGSMLPENRAGSSSDSSVSSSGTICEVSNLCRFLEHTTPHVPSQYCPLEEPYFRNAPWIERSKRRWKTIEGELHPYYVLGDLWESFKEWSAYGAGVPLVLDGTECVTQYYNVSLSAIQLYIDPSKPSPRLRKPGQESDSESAREISSDSSSGSCHEREAKSVVHGNWNHSDKSRPSNHGVERVSLRSKPLTVSSSDETESSNPPGQLIFEYFEHEIPYNREPLADKISDLVGQFPELKTYRSCDLSPASWVSLAWYPIYRIPTGPTLESLSACFLTFHSLSTVLQSPNNDGFHLHCSSGRDMSSKLSVPVLGLAFHKLKASVWDPDGVSEGQKANSLLQAADNWIRLLQDILFKLLDFPILQSALVFL